MARSSGTYSRVIAWLKILLPLIALGLLSTVFLLSTDIDPGADLPFSDAEMADRASSQQVTAPYFSGATSSGALLTITAESARPDPEEPGRAFASSVIARMKMKDESQIMLNAHSATFSDLDDTAILSGEVLIESSTGYVMTTQELTASLSRIEAESTGPVEATGPAGTLNAGRMRIETIENGEDVRLLFTDGVKLVYDPQN
ncbi:LPS export ABC transporter periplasmic protein LptC [Primorskyibacter marinus]|uniref:LPS export ABC transporter periplasmic protein LptC n=1 Tax=Primorskyibacter marinus TaxID=1977320 RepID=UPI000E300C5D|nr:LPS export ABC transporter periplasmic protein LptC [Primorskyibacter marinus]